MKKKKILVIEDDSKIALVLRLRLKAAGYEVLTAYDGVSGLNLALGLEEKPDLVITDIWMPSGSGFSFAYRLRESAPNVPIIFITASKQANLRQMAKDLAAVDFFEKPYDPEELLKAVAKALERRPSQPARPPAIPSPEGPRPEVAGVQAPVPEARTTGTKQILIIEDDRKIAMALALRLRSAGYGAMMAYDAMTGVNSAVKNRPDVVLLDISLPAGNGFMVAERIQTLVPTLTPIIFLTASRQPGLREKAQELGAAGFFEKPFDAAELLAAIQTALSEGPPRSGR